MDNQKPETHKGVALARPAGRKEKRKGGEDFCSRCEAT